MAVGTAGVLLLSTLFVATLGGLLLALASANRYWLVATLVLLAGIPMPLIAPDAVYFSALGGMNSQAAYALLVVAACVLVLASSPSDLPRVFAAAWGLMIFLLFAAASLGWTRDLLSGIRMLTKVMLPFLVFGVAFVVARRRDISRSVERAIYLTCGVSLVLALLQLATSGALAPTVEKAGLFGLPMLAAPHASSANFSFLMLIGAVTAYCRFLANRRLLHLLLCATFTIAIALAFVRVTFAALFIAAFLVHARRASATRVAVAFAVCVIGIGLVVTSEAFAKRMFFDPARAEWSQVFTDPNAFLANVNTSGRTTLWSAAADHFKQSSTLIGSGIGSVDAWIARGGSFGSELHSEVYRLYLELGWLGLLSHTFGLALLWFGMRRDKPPTALEQGRQYPIMRRTAFALLPAYWLTLLTDNSLNYATDFALLIFVIAGLAMVERRRDAVRDHTATRAHLA